MSSKRKILVYSETFLPDLGGLEKNTYTLCNTLIKLGNEVELITSTLDDKGDDYPFIVHRTIDKFKFIKILWKYDLLIVNGGLALKIVLPAYFLRKKYILIFQMATLGNQDNGSRVMKFIRDYFITKASINVSVNKYLTQFFPDNTPKATLLNPFDFNEIGFKKEDGQDFTFTKKYDILFAGRIIEGKGVFLLMEAIKILSESNPVSCAFAGDGDALEALKQYSIQQRINADFFGRLDKGELRKAYRTSKLLVVPSTTHIEGSPLIIAESISMGTPVLVSDQPAMIEIVGEAGLSFKSSDIADLTKKIKEILFEDDRLFRLQKACEFEAEKFTTTSYQRFLDNILQQV